MKKLIVEIDLSDGLSEEDSEILSVPENNDEQMTLIYQLFGYGYKVRIETYGL